MKPRDLECFKQVAAVIGDEFAEYELGGVIDCPECGVWEFKSLGGSFVWGCTTQKHDFWAYIDDSKNPYDHGHKKPDLSEITPTKSDKEAVSKTETRDKTANKYKVLCKGVHLDVYDILLAYAVTNPADQHAIKKMLMAGKRGVKDEIQDRKEAIQSLERAIELATGTNTD